MQSNKKVSRNHVKSKGDCKLYESKRSTTTLQIPKVKPDRHNKSKLESSTDSRLPIFDKPRKYHNCIDTTPNAPMTFKKPPTVLKRKSISLVEIRPNTPKMRVCTPKKWESKEPEHESEISEANVDVSSLSDNETEIAKKVCKMFILNAWRHRRAQIPTLQNKLIKKGNEVDNLNIQVVVLRNLLESEKLRVAVSMSDAAHLKLRLENELKEKSSLINEINNLKTEKNVLEDKESKFVSEIHTLEDELTLTSEQNKYLRRECDDLEKILSEAKVKENYLQKQLNEASIHLKEKHERIEDILKKSVSLQSELKKRNQNLIKENENKERKITECLNKINDMDVALNNSQNSCKVQNENIARLKRSLAKAEEELKTQTLAIGNLKNLIEQYESEREKWNIFKRRIMFEVIKIFPRLFLPYHQYL